jgi:hypothetical protein
VHGGASACAGQLAHTVLVRVIVICIKTKQITAI